MRAIGAGRREFGRLQLSVYTSKARALSVFRQSRLEGGSLVGICRAMDVLQGQFSSHILAGFRRCAPAVGCGASVLVLEIWAGGTRSDLRVEK